MNTQEQADKIRIICHDWYHSDNIGGVDAMAEIMDVLEYDPEDGPPMIATATAES